ncbi:MAG: response regulator [Betaproteobacteria bacterium]|nr:response regulator [Betaproteobacteria bacterium]
MPTQTTEPPSASRSGSNLIGPIAVIPENELRTLVFNELVNMLYRQLPVSITSTMAVAIIMIAALWQQLPGHWLVIWLALMSANQASRFFLYLRFRDNKLQTYQIRWRARVWATGVGISGLLWGATAVFFFTPESAIHQAILVILVLGATTAAVPLIASHMPSLYGFLAPALTPFIARHVLEGDPAHVALGLILLAVTLALLSFGRNYNRLIVTSLRNRYENEALANQFARQNVDLEQARIAAEQANRSKTQFFAAASHDLRQPLHAMGLFASALTQKVREPGVSDIVSSINASVHALEALFNELLDISKLDSGVIKPNVTHFALDEVLDRLRGEFAAEAAANGLRLAIDGGRHVVSSDAVLLERIIRNLISNAIRYTSTGEVAVTATPVNGRVRIEVRDTGIGIREENRQKIFEEFIQLGNPGRTSKKGLGLGLSIVQRLCGLLGYSIRLASEYGEGSTFGFDVPLGTAQVQRDGGAGAAAPLQADLTGKLIVVVDDETAIVTGLKVLLSGWGAKVIGSTTGNDVVAAVHEAGKMPDLLIVDYRLGANENGIEVAQRIRHELDPEIPAILVTASITPDLDPQARAAGLEFMLKPVNPTTLRERIRAALQTR